VLYPGKIMKERSEINVAVLAQQLRDLADEIEEARVSSAGEYEIDIETVERGGEVYLHLKQAHSADGSCDVLVVGREDCAKLITKLQERLPYLREAADE
jgi:hypothetical protein